MSQIIKIKRKNGKYVVKGNGDQYLWELANGAMKRGEMQPTFTMKLRRFFRRLRTELSYRIDELCSYIVGSQKAAELPYIGIEEHHRG